MSDQLSYKLLGDTELLTILLIINSYPALFIIYHLLVRKYYLVTAGVALRLDLGEGHLGGSVD